MGSNFVLQLLFFFMF
jgi:hypothetical protein